MTLRSLSIALPLAVLACSNPPDAPAPNEPLVDAERAALVEEAGAPLFDGLGEHTHPITTDHPGAQRYFDQGLAISFAFNHAEAIRSFQAAQRLDPECAMCFWGEALAHRPQHQRHQQREGGDVGRRAGAAVRRGCSGPIELSRTVRHGSGEGPTSTRSPTALRRGGSRGSLASHSTAPMPTPWREVAASHFLDDGDVQALYRRGADGHDALETTGLDGSRESQAGDRRRCSRRSGERARVAPRLHPGALHLYIHAVEASKTPERGEPAADRLAAAGAGLRGIIVHMPSHIYLARRPL